MNCDISCIHFTIIELSLPYCKVAKRALVCHQRDWVGLFPTFCPGWEKSVMNWSVKYDNNSICDVTEAYARELFDKLKCQALVIRLYEGDFMRKEWTRP